MQRFQSSASSLSATKRTAIRREASDTLYSDPPPGTHASVDLTHFFERNSDGYVCAAIFLDRSTWSLWLGPMKNKTCSEFVRVLDEYRLHARTIHGVELREVHADNDPCFTDNRSGVAHNVVELDRYLRELPPSQSIVFTHSPPETQSLNPVECSVRQLYHLMNFYLQCGNLSSLCWMDMLMAATFVMNRLPHPQSKVMKRRVSSPYELVHHCKPGLSEMVAGRGELVSTGAGRKRVVANKLASTATTLCPPGRAASCARSGLGGHE